NNEYGIVTRAGGGGGTFGTVLPLNAPAFITTSVAYTPNSVELNLSSGIVQTPALTGNQAAVGGALDRSFNSGGGTLPALLLVPPSHPPAAPNMLSLEAI